MNQSLPLTYGQLHRDKEARTSTKLSSNEPFDSLLVLLEGAGMQNQNSRIRMGQLLTQPEEELIVIPYGGTNYHVTQVSYPTSQQFARFTVIPK